MSRIAKRFEELQSAGEKALVCFLTAGDPDYETSKSVILTTAQSGADIIEIGMPFSDPLADGPSIQSASQRAIQAGMTPMRTFELAKSVREQTEVPLVLMTYFNPVQKIGLEKFANEAATSGIDGVIMTDLPPEEAADWVEAAQSAGLDRVFLLAPTSTDERIERVAQIGSGFIYCVSRTGVTGVQGEVPAEVGGIVERIRKTTKKPVAVGFGISGPEHVRKICRIADGAVVGSALVNRIAANTNRATLQGEVREFVSSLKEATRLMDNKNT